MVGSVLRTFCIGRYNRAKILSCNIICGGPTVHQTRCIIGTSKIAASIAQHQHTHQAILKRIHPQHLYSIINDVDQYQNFLPYCQESKVLQTSACGTMYDAVLRVGLPGLPMGPSSSLLEEKYISRVRMSSPISEVGSDENAQLVWTVEAKSIQSELFDSLKSRWQLKLVQNDDIQSDTMHNTHENKRDNKRAPEEEIIVKISCKVNFEVEIQVSNPLISFTLDQVLKDVARKQVDAFEKRCNEIPFYKKG